MQNGLGKLLTVQSLRKAIVPTPRKGDGSVHWESVSAGESIWVTVKKPDSPLRGRPILVTKRPDGMFAVTGGAGT